MQFDVVPFAIPTFVWAAAISAVIIALVAGAAFMWWRRGK
jgi:hypothetical protein